MKGLLLKEWYSFSRSYAVVYFVFATVRIIMAGNSFVRLFFFGASVYTVSYEDLLYITIIPFMCVGNLILDEREKWEIYRSTLPFSKEQIVYSKYIFSTIIIVFFVFISALGMLPNLFKGNIEINDFTTMLTWIITTLIIPLSIMLIGAFALKNKARIIYLLSVLLCSMAVFLVTVYYDNTARQEYIQEYIYTQRDSYPAMTEENFESILFLTPSQQLFLLGILIVIFLASAVVSTQFYKKRTAD